MIEFAHDNIAEEFERIKPSLRELLKRLDAYCYAQGIQRISVTKLLSVDADAPSGRGESALILIGRRYNAEEYARLVEYLHACFPRQETEGRHRKSLTSIEGFGDTFCLRITIDESDE